MRNILVHYHIFKNAGTSLDRILEHNYGSDWLQIEADQAEGSLSGETLHKFLAENPDARAVSSHTASIVPIESAEINILPLVILRNPIDRALSAYRFERSQGDVSIGSKFAANSSFQEYVERFIGDKSDRRFRNFQVWRLRNYGSSEFCTEFERSLATVNSLPWVGVVDCFDFSLRALQLVAEAHIPGFDLIASRLNVTSREGECLEDRLEEAREQLGDKLYQELLFANLADWALWEHARMLLLQRS